MTSSLCLKRFLLSPICDYTICGDRDEYLKEHPEEFACVSVDVGGYGIIWGDELDLSCDELWEHGEQVNTPFDGLMSFGDASELWGLSESTLRKAVSYGKLVNGVDVCKFGKQWVVSKAAMKRAYGEVKQ